MYADMRYHPQPHRAAGVGGALAVSGLIAAGMLLLAPQIMPRPKTVTLTGTNIALDPPPPAPLPKPLTKTAPHATTPLPVAPDPIVRDASSSTTVATTSTIGDPPSPGLVADPGPAVRAVEPPPVVVPPLIAATPDPRFADGFQPDYPGVELRAQREGSVTVRIRIGTDGRVKQVEAVRATSAAFLDATRRQALGRWRFRPATRGGEPQESWREMTVHFRLTGA